MAKPVIIVHGGAGKWPRSSHSIALAGVRKAAKTGFRVLNQGGTALDAVEMAVVAMEDNPIFNAGTGSTLNIEGEVEDDAAIMDGRSRQGGGVAMVKDVRNPVRLARLVMERTDHVLIGGSGAEKLARAFRLPKANPRVSRRVRALRHETQRFKTGRLAGLPRNYRLFRAGLLSPSNDTVGALTLDSQGNLAAACSTGGMSLKLPGRIGDTPILGAGLYADNSTGAATATGVGELAIRSAISRFACDLMKRRSAATAALQATRMVGHKFGKGLGIITLKKNGQYGAAHNTRDLCWAVENTDAGLIAQMTGK